MKFKDLSLIFTAGVLAVLYVFINIISYVFIEKKLLVFGIMLTVAVYLVTFLAGVLVP